MPDPNNRSARDFSQYDEMSDEQLREILRKDASNLEGEDTDMELMLHIMEVLAKRRKEAQEDISPEEALERFNTKYTYTDNSLISEERPAKKKSIGFSRWQRWVATVAALLILVFGSSITAQAFGFNLFDIIAKWTQETFHFGYFGQTDDTGAPNPDIALQYSGLIATLSENNIPTDMVPTWLPDGYSESDVRVTETPKQRYVTAKYDKGENSIRIRFADYLEGYPQQIEQSDELLEIYARNGIDFYIFKNYEQLRAVWIYENYEYFIMGSLTLEEVKGIIDSIGKG